MTREQLKENNGLSEDEMAFVDAACFDGDPDGACNALEDIGIDVPVEDLCAYLGY